MLQRSARQQNKIRYHAVDAAISFFAVAWWPGGAGGAIAPPAGLKNRGATEHKGRQQLKVCNNLFSFRYVNHTMVIESAITRWNKGCETLPAPPPPPPPPPPFSPLHPPCYCIMCNYNIDAQCQSNVIDINY